MKSPAPSRPRLHGFQRVLPGLLGLLALTAWAQKIPPTLILLQQALGGSDASASSLNPATDSVHIHGIVLDSHTGKPVSRALVTGFGDRLATMTDHDGRFALDLRLNSTAQGSAQRVNMVAARMVLPSLIARKPGYTSEPASRLLQMYGLEQLDKDIILKLTPESALQGRVVASGDDHPEGVRVSLFARQIQDGAGRWAMRSSTTTDSQGEFRFGGLAAGDYRLQTQEWSDQPSQSESGQPALRYAPVAYPAGSSPTAGPELHLPAGETLPVNFNLHPETFYPVRIPVAEAGNGIGLQARVERNDAMAGMNLRYVPRDKAIEGFLPSGAYQVTVQTVGPNAAAATVPLTVGGSPAETAPVTLSPLISIPVIVHEEFTGREQSVPVRLPGGIAPTVQVLLQPEEMNVPTPMTTPNREDGQRMTLERVLPGAYRAQILPYRGYVAAATSGGTNLLHAPLVVASGSSIAPIDIVLRDDSATIEGSLDPSLLSGGADGSGSPSAYILCLSAEPGALQPMQSMARNDGKFMMRNVPPGSYRVYASREPFNNVEYRSESFLRANGGKGAAVTVEPGVSATVTVTSLLGEEMP